MLKKAAMLFGVVFLVVGVAGFIPGITNDNDHLLGIFHVDGVHNLVHIASGVVALLAARSAAYAKTYFQVFGLVYALVTVLGFVGGDDSKVLGFLVVNMADNFLHLVIALAALYLGFGVKAEGSNEKPAEVV